MGCGTSAPVQREGAISKSDVPAAAVDPDITRLEAVQGTLGKRSAGRLGHWQSRFFRLNNWYLVYWASATEVGPPAGVMDVSTAYEAQLNAEDTRCFSVVFQDGSRYDLRASDTATATVWVDSLASRIEWAEQNPEDVAAAAGAADTSGQGAAAAAPGPIAGAGSFGGLAAAAKRQREQAALADKSLSSLAGKSGASGEKRSSVFFGARAGTTGAGGAMGVIGEESDDDESADSDSEDETPHGRGGGGARRPMSVDAALRAVTAELGPEPLIESTVTKQNNNQKWQKRHLRMLGGALCYFTKRSKADMAPDSPLGNPRGAIPLVAIAEVRNLPRGSPDADKTFEVLCAARPDDDDEAEELEARCADDATDQPKDRRAKPPWERSFVFRLRDAEGCDTWVESIRLGVQWWSRFRDLVRGGRPGPVDVPSGELATRAQAVADEAAAAAAAAAGGRGGAVGGGGTGAAAAAAAAAATAAASAAAEPPVWLSSIRERLSDAEAVRERRRKRRAEGVRVPEAAARADDDTLRDLEAAAVRIAMGEAQATAGAARAEAEDAVRAAAGPDGEGGGPDPLVPVIAAVTDRLVETARLCKAFAAPGVGKTMIRGFDETLTTEVRPHQTGAFASGLTFQVMLGRIGALERYVGVRSHAVSGLGVSFRPSEASKARLLQEQRSVFVQSAVSLAQEACDETRERLLLRVGRWDDTVALGGGEGTRERTVAPREIARLFNAFLDQAASTRCALLQQELLAVMWTEVSRYSRGVVDVVEGMLESDPGRLVEDEGTRLVRVVNDCMSLARLVQEKGAAVSAIMEKEMALLDRRELEREEAAAEAAGSAGGGDDEEEDGEEEEDGGGDGDDGFAAQLREEREALDSLGSDRTRAVEQLMQAGFAMVGVLAKVIGMELTRGLPEPKGAAAAAAAAAGAGGDGASAVGHHAGAGAGEDGDGRAPLAVLFEEEWDSPRDERQVPVPCAFGIVWDWLRELEQDLDRIWIRRLVTLLLEAVVQRYCDALVAKVALRGVRLFSMMRWKLTAERRGRLRADVGTIRKGFAMLETRYAVQRKEVEAAERAAREHDSALAVLLKAAAETETELSPVFNLLEHLTAPAWAPAKEAAQTAERLVTNYAHRSVELLGLVDWALQRRDDMDRHSRADVLASVERRVASNGRVGAPSSHGLHMGSVRHNTEVAASGILDGVLPAEPKRQDDFWRRHSPDPPRGGLRAVFASRAPPPTKVVSEAEAAGAMSEIDGADVSFADFLGAAGAASGAPSASRGGGPPPPPPRVSVGGAAAGDGESARSPGSVRSSRRRSAAPRSWATFRAPRAGDSSRPGSDDVGVPGATDRSPRAGDGLRPDAEPAAPVPERPPAAPASAATSVFVRRPPMSEAPAPAPAPGNPFAPSAPQSPSGSVGKAVKAEAAKADEEAQEECKQQ